MCKDSRYEMTLEPQYNVSMVDDKYEIVAFERGK